MNREPIYERVMDDVASLFHHPRYHHPSDPTPEAPVSLIDTIEQDLHTVVHEVIGKHAPEVAGVLDAVAASPLAQEVLALGPLGEFEQLALSMLRTLADEAARHATATPAPDPAPEPVPAMDEAPPLEPLPEPGPAVGGVA